MKSLTLQASDPLLPEAPMEKAVQIQPLQHPVAQTRTALERMETKIPSLMAAKTGVKSPRRSTALFKKQDSTPTTISKVLFP